MVGWCVLLLLVGAGNVWSAGGESPGFKPRAFRVPGLPDTANYYWSVAESPEGWIAASGTGVVRQLDGEWTLLRHPSLSEVRVVVPYAGGVLVAGAGVCTVLDRDRGWSETNVDENFRTAVATPDGTRAFAASHRSVYSATADGRLERVLAFPEDREAYVQRLGDEIVVFSGGEARVWNGTGFVVDAARFSWSHDPMVLVSATEAGGYIAAGRGQMIFAAAKGSSPREIHPALWTQLRQRSVVSLAVVDDILVVASYRDGVLGYGLSSGEKLWQIELEEFGGNVWSMRRLGRDLVVGATDGLYVVPDVARFAFHSYPKRDLYFSTATSLGPVMTGGAGAFFADGRPLDLPGRVISVAEARPGEFVIGELKRVRWGDRTIDMPGPREVITMAAVGPDAVVAVQTTGATRVQRDGTLQPLPTPGATVYSAAGEEDGTMYVGTTAGTFVFSASGEVVRRFGRGMTLVRRAAGDVWSFDGDGHVFDRAGNRRGTVPFEETLDAVAWQGTVVALGRSREHDAMVGVLDPAKDTWTPFDLPLASMPKALGSDAHRLYVFLLGQTLALTDPPRLPEPDMRARLLRAGRPLAATILAPDDDAVQLKVPVGRLGPGPATRYAYRVNAGPWEAARPGARVEIPRLRFGSTEIELRGSGAGVTRVQALQVVRSSPWWMGWPGIVLGTVALGGSFGLMLRWRTQRLRRKAEELARLVAEKTQETAELYAARDEFYAKLSHEIRNPLNGLVGLGEILLESMPAADARRGRVWQLFAQCLDQVRSTVDSVLDSARIRRGEVTLRPVDFDYQLACEAAVHAIDPAGSISSVRHGSAPRRLRADVQRIRQIVSNLVGNAVKYGQPPFAEVVTEVNPAADEVFWLTVRVRNQGPEVTAEEWERLLRQGGRGTAAREGGVAGSGFGLVLSREMAEALGGTLTARSADGVTTATLVVPCERAGEEPARPAPVWPDRRALVVEDEAYNRQVLGHYLGKLGLTCEWAIDGRSAREALASSTFDLVVSDWWLPDGDAGGVIAAALSSGGGRRPRVIVVTALTEPKALAELMRSGVDAVVPKPVSLTTLRAAIGDLAGEAVSAPVELPVPEIRRSLGQDIRAAIAAAEQGRNPCAEVHRLRSRALLLADPRFAELLARSEAELRGERVEAGLALLQEALRELGPDARDEASEGTPAG